MDVSNAIERYFKTNVMTPEERRLARQVYAYMLQNAGDNVDRDTGEVNATGLAEDAARHFGLDVDGDHWFFDLSAIVAEAHEKILTRGNDGW